MGVATVRSFRAIRYALLLAACAPLAMAAPSMAADTAAATATAATDGSVRFGSWGVDLSSRDLKVKPGDDFERYASGAWMDANEIPADKSQNGVGSELNDRNQERLRTIVMARRRTASSARSITSYMDEARLEQLDAAPLKADLARVDAIKNKAEFTAHMADSFADFGATLFGARRAARSGQPDDEHRVRRNVGGMGLPDRDYYLLDKYKPQRDAYRAYIQRTLELTDTPNASAARGCDPRVRDRDRQAVLAAGRPARPRQAQQSDDAGAAGRPMRPASTGTAICRTTKVVSPKLIVGDNTAVKALAALYDKTPLETLKRWQRFKVADQASAYLSKRFVDSQFEFAKTLTGAKELRPRWRRGIAQVDGRLGELLGETYVQRYFSPQSKAMMEELVANLKKAAAIRIKGNSWMERGDQAGRAGQARQDGRDGRLSRQVPRLFEAGDEAGRPLRQRQAQLGVRMGLSAERPRQAGRPQEMGDEPGDGERL